MIRTIKRVLVYPEDFFMEVPQGAGKALMYFMFISFLVLIIQWLILWLGFIPGNFSGIQYIFSGGFSKAVIPFVFFLGGVLLVFVYSGIIAAIGKAGKLEIGFGNAFKGISYGSTPLILFSWIPVLNLLFYLWGIYLQVRGLAILSKNRDRDVFLVILPSLVITGVVFLLVLYFYGWTAWANIA